LDPQTIQFSPNKEDRFRELIEGLNVITYEYDIVNRRFIYVSRQAETILGYAQDMWKEKRFWVSHIAPEDQDWANEYSHAQIKQEKDHEFEYRMIAVDGSVKWFKDIASVSSENGVPVTLQGVLIDISERKQYENDLKESKDRYKALVEQQTEMITRWKPDGTFTYVNDVYCDFFGKRRHQLIGKSYIPPMPIEDLDRFTKFFLQLDKDNPVGHFTHRVIMPDGSLRWLRWTDTAIFDKDGNISEYQTVGRDITARKKAEEALKQSEEKYRRLIENTNVIAWEYDIASKKYLYVSQQAEKILGYPMQQWYSEYFWFKILHDDDKEWAKKFSNEKVDAGINHEFEYRVMASDGSVRWFKDITTVDRYNGKISHLHGIFIDITERKKIEEESKQNEIQLFSLFENAPIGMSLKSMDGRFLKVNSSFCNTMGYSKSELLNMTFRDVTHKDDLQKDIEMLNKALEEGTSTYNLTKRYIRKDGGIVHAILHVSVIRDLHDTPQHMIAQVVDITEKKIAEDKLKETEFRLGTVINNLPNIIFYENHQGTPKIAENVINILGYTSKELSENKELFISLIHPEDNARIERGKAVWDTVVEKGYHKKEYRLKHRSGKYLWFEDLMYLVKGEEKNYIVGFMIDITERKEREEKLNQTQARLSAVLNNLSNVAIYEYGDDVNFISENIQDILGFSSSDFMSDKNFFSNLILPEVIKQYDEGVLSWMNKGAKGVLSSVIGVKDKDGEVKWLEDHMYEVKPGTGKPYFSGIMIDITKQRNTEAKFRETESKLAAILTNLPKVVIYQSKGNKDFISDNIEDMIGYKPDEILKDKYFFSSIMPEEDKKAVKKALVEWHKGDDKGILVMDFRLKKKSGEYIWVEDHMYRVQNEEGSSYLSGILIDITERKHVEQKVSQSLKEKEILLKEIHHRVKNNLQVVSSLLKLQSSYVTDKNTHDILLDSQNRVRSMALVHQKLYQSKDFSQIDFKEYINQLSEQLFNVFKQKSSDVKINVISSNASLGIDLAIPCGLIINELVSNSLKYAFPGNSSGVINIEINNPEDEEICEIVVSDNGIGFPKGINFRETLTLGLQLVNTLVGQIDGEIEMENKNGTAFRIKFKNPRLVKTL
jgi:PAS domain S-box-containing protein